MHMLFYWARQLVYLVEVVFESFDRLFPFLFFHMILFSVTQYLLLWDWQINMWTCKKCKNFRHARRCWWCDSGHTGPPPSTQARRATHRHLIGRRALRWGPPVARGAPSQSSYQAFELYRWSYSNLRVHPTRSVILHRTLFVTWHGILHRTMI